VIARYRQVATHVCGTTNVYADLGYRAPESMRVRAELVSRIADLLAEKGMTEPEAANFLSIPEPEFYKMLRGSVSLHKLTECLTQLGQEARTIVRPKSDKTLV
jgi:predicted XRE-type DNA-binding protein